MSAYFNYSSAEESFLFDYNLKHERLCFSLMMRLGAQTHESLQLLCLFRVLRVSGSHPKEF